jgi:hypothetical protein
MYYKTTLKDGKLDIDYTRIAETNILADGVVYVRLRDESDVPEDWEVVTKEEYDNSFPVFEHQPLPKPVDTQTELAAIRERMTEQDATIESILDALVNKGLL